MLNIRHLHCALEIKKYCNLSEAARQVHLTQSALTQSIKKLEESIGWTLFTRSSSGMFVTPEGDVFLNRFGRAFSLLESFATTLFSADKHGRTSFLRGVTARQLDALVHIVELQSYTAASVKMGLSQPTLHRTIRDLETLCQQTLFNRSPTGVEATWRARQFSRIASLYFSELSQGLDEVAELNGEKLGNVRIGSLPLARSEIVPKAVLALLEEAPGANISIVDGPYEEQLHALLHGHIDILVGALRFPALSDDIEQIPLFDDYLSIVTGSHHPLAARCPLTTQDWQSLKWIAAKEGTPARKAFGDLLQAICPDHAYEVIECSSLMAIRGLLINSDRAAILPARQVEIDVAAGLLAVNPTPLSDAPRQIGYTLRKNWHPTRLQKEFLDHLRAKTDKLD